MEMERMIWWYCWEDIRQPLIMTCGSRSTARIGCKTRKKRRNELNRIGLQLNFACVCLFIRYAGYAPWSKRAWHSTIVFQGAAIQYSICAHFDTPEQLCLFCFHLDKFCRQVVVDGGHAIEQRSVEAWKHHASAAPRPAHTIRVRVFYCQHAHIIFLMWGHCPSWRRVWLTGHLLINVLFICSEQVFELYLWVAVDAVR